MEFDQNLGKPLILEDPNLKVLHNLKVLPYLKRFPSFKDQQNLEMQLKSTV
jgi:hypothetical protein